MREDPALYRRRVYALLITLAAATTAARILTCELVYEPSLHRDERIPESKGRKWPQYTPKPMPTFSSNDRSRWATVRALVDDGTYVIGRRNRETVLVSAVAPLGSANASEAAVLAAAGYQTRIKSDYGIVTADGWQTVDKVLHPELLEFYSSKPPFLATLVAGLYWLLQTFSMGVLTLRDHPFAVVRIILLIVNWLPFLIYLILLVRLVERYGTTDWGRYFVVAAACFATLVTPFVITLNNHTLGTFSVLFAIYPALRIVTSESTSPSCFMLSGLFAGFAVCNEFPAAAFVAALGLLLLWHNRAQTLTLFVPAALLPIAALFVTNYLAIGLLRPAYSEFGGPWYEYEGSHWNPPPPGQMKHGIDWAGLKESRAEYILHMLLGHHGLFSLTPIWILAMWGIGYVLRRCCTSNEPQKSTLPTSFALLTLMVTLVVLGFYLFNRTVNYGGWTCGLRWLMWLSPLWLVHLVPVADYVSQCRWGRRLGYVLLAVSIFSASFPAWNPWRHPWLYQLMEALGWQGY